MNQQNSSVRPRVQAAESPLTFFESMPSLGLTFGLSPADHRGCVREGRQTASTRPAAAGQRAKDNAAASVGSRKTNRGRGGMDSENA